MNHAKKELCREEMTAEWTGKNYEAPLPAKKLCSLRETFEAIPDYRRSQGLRCSLATVLTLATAARLAGYHGIGVLHPIAEPGAVGGGGCVLQSDQEMLYRT